MTTVAPPGPGPSPGVQGTALSPSHVPRDAPWRTAEAGTGETLAPPKMSDRPVRSLPKRLFGGKASLRSSTRLENQTFTDSQAPFSEEDGATSVGRVRSVTADHDSSGLSGNSYPSPATPLHGSSFFHSPYAQEKEGGLPSGASLAEHLSKAVLQIPPEAQADWEGSSPRSNSEAVGLVSEPFRFQGLPPSLLNDGFLYRQQGAYMILSSSDLAKALRAAWSSKWKARKDAAKPERQQPEWPRTQVTHTDDSHTACQDDCGDDETDHGEESSTDFTWLENSGNKKKRKSTRSIDVLSGASGGTPVCHEQHSAHPSGHADASQDAEPSRSSGSETASQSPANSSRVPYSSALIHSLRSRIQLKYRLIRAERERKRAEEERQLRREALAKQQEQQQRLQQERLEEELERQNQLAQDKKQPQKRPSKAERRAQALRGGSNAPKAISIAAIRARTGQRPGSGPSPAQQSQSQRCQADKGPSTSHGAKQAEAGAQSEVEPEAKGPGLAESERERERARDLEESAAASAPAPARHFISEASESSRPVDASASPAPRDSASVAISSADAAASPDPPLAAAATAAAATAPPTPRGPFTFVVPSAITRRLETIRQQLQAVSLKLSDTLASHEQNTLIAHALDRSGVRDPLDISAGNIDDVTGDWDPAPLLASAQLSSQPPVHETIPQVADPAIVSAIFSSKDLHAPVSSRSATLSHTHQPRPPPSPQAAPVPRLDPTRSSSASPSPSPHQDKMGHKSPLLSASAQPPHATPPKLTRRKKATMNNVHHRDNYVPSRTPSDGHSHTRASGRDKEKAPPAGLDHPTTTCGLFDGEWMCIFCEYELLYGEPPLMARACRNRKKVVAQRKKAQSRKQAHSHDHHRHHQGSASQPASAAGHHHSHHRCECGNSIHDSDSERAPSPSPRLSPTPSQSDLASVFSALNKDKASQAALAKYIASGGKTAPPPLPTL